MYLGEEARVLIPHPNQSEYLNGWQNDPDLVVECDVCKCLSSKKGTEPGWVTEQARAEGFTTYRGQSVADPKGWCCHTCSNQIKPSK